MNSELRTFGLPEGEIQRVQIVRWEDWDALSFLEPSPAADAFSGFVRVYRQFLVPAAPWVFPKLVLFQLPGATDLELTQAATVLQKGVRVVFGKPTFKTNAAAQLWARLEQQNTVAIVSGKLPYTKVIPVGEHAGYLSEANAPLTVNANFFIMDPFDCATPYDHVGQAFGLRVRDGQILSPPLYQREALLVHEDGRVEIAVPRLEDLTLELRRHTIQPGKNALLFTRPTHKAAPYGTEPEIVVVGDTVVDVRTIGSKIPASGFVLQGPDLGDCEPGDKIFFHGLEDIRFGIQVGNSLVRNGERTPDFVSPFYNIRALDKVPFPPSLYPMEYETDRAARIALGADAENHPMLLWAEGSGKLGYEKGQESCGVSLSEFAEICAKCGMTNGVNLDGGGSAQLLVNGTRDLRISDRSLDNEDLERAVPMALAVTRP